MGTLVRFINPLTDTMAVCPRFTQETRGTRSVGVEMIEEAMLFQQAAASRTD